MYDLESRGSRLGLPAHRSSRAVPILLVDDQPGNLDLLCAILDDPHYEFVRCTSGTQALASLRQRRFAVALLDVMMPGMDGFQVLKTIHSSSEYHKPPVIFVTAVADDFRFIVRGFEHGCVDYIVKPIDAEILKMKVRNIAALFEEARDLREKLIESETVNAELRRENASQKVLLDRDRALSAKREAVSDGVPTESLSMETDGQMEPRR